MSATLALAKQLITCPSVTPDDAGCQEILIARLAALGFSIERLPFGDVTNFWACLGKQSPLLVFAGHTDVVPTGPVQEWHSPPFAATVKDGFLYGRGAADMKGSLAAMVTACESYLQNQQPRGGIAFLVTSDEEGIAINGTQKVMAWLKEKNIRIDYCIVGEPSSSLAVGDTIKIGRRGSLSGCLTIKGVQGHIAYPHLTVNPIHRALLPLAELCATEWDQGNTSFPPTSFQISNIHGGTGAGNVIPGSMQVDFNFRFSTELDEARIRGKTETILQQFDIDYELQWNLSGNPFLTSAGSLIKMASASITAVTGIIPELSTSGGTSDGRFIAPTGAQVIELGPCNATIHKVNECVAVADLDTLSGIYADLLGRLLGK